MLSVRAKLILLVALAALPAAFSAAFEVREARNDVVEQIQRRLAASDRGFDRELDEDEANATIALRIAADDPRVVAASKGGADPGSLKMLAWLDPDALALVVDGAGKVLASTDPKKSPASISPAAEGFEQLAIGSAQTWSRVTGVPIAGGPARLVVAIPVDSDFLEHVEKKVGADLALKVDDVVVAACADHPAPQLEAHGGGAITIHKGDKTFALTTFNPAALAIPGHEVELTASRDISPILAESHHDLLVTLLRLALATLFALAIAAWVATRMGRAVQRVSGAAKEIAAGAYPHIDDVKTGDELQALAATFNTMVEGLRERDRLRSTFGKFVARHVIERALKQNLEFGKGDMVPVTVLFSDIRGFTSISEKMSPRSVVEFLNLYFTEMVDVVTKHGGEVDKFIGDAILAVFGAVESKADDPLQAVLAAIEMKARLRQLNVRFKEMGIPEIRTGIGIHTGTVLAGTIGHEQRMEYTVIGDAVNLASRLETATKELQVDILLSDSTYQAIKDQVEAEPIKRIKVKGRVEEVEVYRLVGLTGSHKLQMPT